MVLLVLFGLVPAAEASRSSVNDRINKIRAAVRDQVQDPVQLAAGEKPGNIQVAQWGNTWYNWNNWNNWDKWNNWYNWGNWGNWGNW